MKFGLSLLKAHSDQRQRLWSLSAESETPMQKAISAEIAIP